MPPPPNEILLPPLLPPLSQAERIVSSRAHILRLKKFGVFMNQHVLLQKRKADTQKKKTQE